MTDETLSLSIRKPNNHKDIVQMSRELEAKVENEVRNRLELEAYPATSRMAVVEVEKLKLLLQIEKVPWWAKMEVAVRVDRTWTAHPGRYATVKELIVSETSMSYSEYCDLVTFHNVVIPYLESLRLDPYQFVASHTASNIREMVPYLRALATGEPSERENVNAVIEKLANKAREILPQGHDEGDVRRAVLNEILENATGTTQNLRKTLRAEETPEVVFYRMRRNGTSYLVAEVTNDQVNMLLRTIGRHIEIVPVEMPEGKRVPVIRNLLEEVHG